MIFKDWKSLIIYKSRIWNRKWSNAKCYKEKCY